MRYLVTIAGVGGMGSLTIGRILAEAGLSRYAHVCWYPSYNARQRGGHAECTVILSDQPISSPALYDLEALIVMHGTQVGRFRDRVTVGGLAVVERGCSLRRNDVKEFEIPGEEIARSVGNTGVTNQVFLGAYVKASGCLPPEVLDAELERRFQRRPEMLALNRDAFWGGVRLVDGRLRES